MRGFAGFAASGMLLAAASPAAALERSEEDRAVKGSGAVPEQIRSASLVPQSVSLDSRGLVPVEDPTAPRLFGSVPVGENVAVGVGLFSVVGSTEKEQMRRRMDPARELLRASDTRVAAVGMSLRF